jgi:hypothetical protein
MSVGQSRSEFLGVAGALLITALVAASAIVAVAAIFILAISLWEFAGLGVAAAAYAGLCVIGVVLGRRFPNAGIATTSTGAVALGLVGIIAFVVVLSR